MLVFTREDDFDEIKSSVLRFLRFLSQRMPGLIFLALAAPKDPHPSVF
jgi:hypothetical protein